MLSQHCTMYFCIFWRACTLHLYLLSHSSFFFVHFTIGWVKYIFLSRSHSVQINQSVLFCHGATQTEINSKSTKHFLYFCAVSSCPLKCFSLFVKSMTLIKHYTTYDCTVSYESHWNRKIKATGTHSNKDIYELF